ncbi:MAG: TetR/AcrR family transcriptional regulator [Pleurocapsa minor GSE-CHR-MK-17-07R]|jgi:AcrR family transcriptional regulator|nr:TetR/AcrR family transcriptional regulator [Pleurocapsa minor GSE-CHR-MK 17-07R]
MNIKRSPTKTLLIRSANQVILRDGVQGLTLEAVALEAGVSKGGLLYHFPSKDALVVGLIEFYIAQFEDRLRAHVNDAEGPKAWMRAYVLASLSPPPDEFDVSAGLIAAAALNPALLDPLRERYDAWQAMFDQSAHTALARVVRLAIDGWWVTTLLALAPTSDHDRAALQNILLTLIEESL